MWESLADLPAVFPDGKSLDKRANPWLFTGLVRSYMPELKKNRPPMSRLQGGIAIVTGWWTVPLTIMIFWLWYLRRHDWLGTAIQIAALLLCTGFACWFHQLAKATLQGKPPVWIMPRFNRSSWLPYLAPRNYALNPVVVTLALFAVSSLVSFGAINGTTGWTKSLFLQGEQSLPVCPGTNNPYMEGEYEQIRRVVPRIMEHVGLRAFSDITWREVSIKPDNWSDTPESLRFVKGPRFVLPDLRFLIASNTFLAGC